MPNISFKPKQVTKKILSPLQERGFDVISKRFGLGDDPKGKTLEAIGKIYNITRERVRQIENAALTAIKKSNVLKENQAVFKELKDIIHSLGAVVTEEELLNSLSKDKAIQNHINFYLVLGDEFKKEKEDEHFRVRWTVDEAISEEVHNALKKLYADLPDNELFSENDIINRLLENIKTVSEKYRNEEIAKRWLSLSKKIAKNPLGEYGRSSSPSVVARGIRDYAFLVLRKHGSPLHFSDVAKSICDTFDRPAHVATCHNELIKDPRFVLVGRGQYALADWGYKKGIVREVITDIIKKEGPLSKEDVVEKVLKERFLKKNTILVNLQNSKHFKKNKNGLYSLA